MDDKKKDRRWIRWVGVVLVLAGAVYLGVHLWYGPKVGVRRVERMVRRFWSGSVDMGEVSLNDAGFLRVGWMRLWDASGSVDVRVEDMVLRFANWPSAKPVVREVEITQVHVRAVAGEDGLRIPLGGDSGQEKGKRWLLEKVRIGQIDVEAVSEKVGRLLLEGLYAQAQREGEGYRFSLRQIGSSAGQRLEIGGSFDEVSEEVAASLVVDGDYSAGEVAVWKYIFRVGGEWIARGRVQAEGSVRGRLGEKGGMSPAGKVWFEDWRVRHKGREVGREVCAVLDVNDGRFDFRRVQARTCGGRVKGWLSIERDGEGASRYSGEVTGVGLELSQVTELLGTKKKLSRGKATLSYTFEADSCGWESVKGRGVVFADDSDLWTMPVVGQIFSYLGFKKLGVVGMSDGEAAFEMSGRVITLERAHLSNRVSALEFEPGGKVDMGSKEVDLYVIAMPLKGLDRLIRAIPVINLFAAMKDKLVRLRVKGEWSEPASKLVRKEPFVDVKEGTMVFIRGVVDGGGHFTEEVRKGLGLVFNGEQTRKAE